MAWYGHAIALGFFSATVLSAIPSEGVVIPTRDELTIEINGRRVEGSLKVALIKDAFLNHYHSYASWAFHGASQQSQ